MCRKLERQDLGKVQLSSIKNNLPIELTFSFVQDGVTGVTYDTVTRLWDRLGEFNYCAPQTPKFNPDEKLSCSFDVSPLPRMNNETKKHSSLS